MRPGRLTLRTILWRGLCGIAASALWIAGTHVAAQTSGNYTIRADQPRQVIKGLGLMIHNDSVASGNTGMPDAVISVPHDLTPEERTRFYHQLLHGFRYVRLGLGVHLRGTDADQKHIIERYPGQMDDLRTMQDESGIEGFDVEYWSPAPFWKQNKTFYGGTIAGNDPAFLNAFSDAMIEDLRYLQAHGLHIAMWGMQNEPDVGRPRKATGPHDDAAKQHYGTCYYSPEDYAVALRFAAPKVRALLPNVEIHAPSRDGPAGPYAAEIRKDPALEKYIDAWTWHQIGHDSNDQIDKRAEYLKGADGKPVYQNEFEYQPWDHPTFNSFFMNTGQSVMNWLVFEDSPTWFWLHALRPVTNIEAKGYGLGFWLPKGQPKQALAPNLEPGHWVFNAQNWNALAGFVKYMPWDSTRLQVDEDTVRYDQRILVWRSKQGELGIALSNRGPVPFTFHLHGEDSGTLVGHRYTVTALNQPIGRKRGGEDVAITVQPQSFEFWIASETKTAH